MGWEIATVLVLIGVVGFLSYFAKSIDEGHYPIKMFFFVLAFFFALLTINYSTLVATDAGANTEMINMLEIAYNALLYITVFVIFYVVVYFIIKAVNKYRQSKKEEKEGFDNLIG